MRNEETLVTKEEIFLSQAPNFNFELDEDELVAEGLKRGFLTPSDQTRDGEKLFEINLHYRGDQ